jgi:hypothetical protein
VGRKILIKLEWEGKGQALTNISIELGGEESKAMTKDNHE